MMQENSENAAPVVISKKEYAEHRGCAPSYISKLIKFGKLVSPAITEDGRINRDLADEQLKTQSDPARSATRKAPASLTFASEKAQSEALKRQRLEIELAKEKAELVQRADVDSAAEEAARELRNRILEVPSEVAQRLIGVDTEQQIILILKEALVKALTKVANEIQEMQNEDRGTEKGDVES